jgi:hypothetical protein
MTDTTCYRCNKVPIEENRMTLVHHIPVGEDTFTENITFCLSCARSQMYSTLELFIVQRIILFIGSIIINLLLIFGTYDYYINNTLTQSESGEFYTLWPKTAILTVIVMIVTGWMMYESLSWMTPIHKEINDIELKLVANSEKWEHEE